jgi:DNA-binding FadR family transcriptional regulator
MPRPGAEANAKRAAKVADLIVEDVMALGWPAGEVLGSESELLERYQVSRAVFREAVRLVEHEQVARTRRGPGGGLVIAEPSIDAVISAVALSLYRIDARLDEILEARIILEEIACQLACGRADENDVAQLRRVTAEAPPGDDDPPELHALVAAISRNPGLELFINVFNRVTQLYRSDWPQKVGSTMWLDSAHAHAMIAEAIMAGEAELARGRMRKHLQAEADVSRRRRHTKERLPDSVILAESGLGKGAEAVARNIARSILSKALQPGELVGTESELIEREGVSRALLREAVRLLEHHQIARMRRGPGGGLFVMAPSARAVTEISAIYLARHGMTLEDLGELRTGVEVAIAGLAATRVDAEGTAVLRDALTDEEDASDGQLLEAAHDLHAAVAEMAHNRVMMLVAQVLIRLSRLYQVERLAPKARTQIAAEVLRTHVGIAAAVEAGDRDLARHRMRRHLERVGTLMG